MLYLNQTELATEEDISNNLVYWAKMLKATDKRQIRELLKSNNVFRSQAMQFIRGFDKILSGAKQTDTPDAVLATLAKTDLGMIHSAISPQL